MGSRSPHPHPRVLMILWLNALFLHEAEVLLPHLSSLLSYARERDWAWACRAGRWRRACRARCMGRDAGSHEGTCGLLMAIGAIPGEKCV